MMNFDITEEVEDDSLSRASVSQIDQSLSVNNVSVSLLTEQHRPITKRNKPRPASSTKSKYISASQG